MNRLTSLQLFQEACMEEGERCCGRTTSRKEDFSADVFLLINTGHDYPN